MGRLKGLLSGIALSCVVVLLFLLAGEAYLSRHYHNERERIAARAPGRDLCTMASPFPELIYTRVPGKCDTNSHGFRDTEHGYEKPDGVFRIVIIGDSVAEGQGVPLRDVFGKVLERQLHALTAEGGRDVEVIILAQSGYSTSQELFLLEHAAFRYAPDLIVWSYVLNDPAHPVYHDSNGELGRYYFEPVLHTAHFVARKLFEISERIKSIDCGREYHTLLHCAYWEEVQANIRTIAALSRQRQVPAIFVIFPVLEDGENFDHYSLAPVHARLAAAASAAGLPVVDELDAFRAYPPGSLSLPLASGHDPLHPNATGHRIAAQHLYDYIVAGGYLDSPSP
ncbi:MAG: SGNH/GDSL hydrolase family protein [Halioglobus sp.]